MFSETTINLPALTAIESLRWLHKTARDTFLSLNWLYSYYFTRNACNLKPLVKGLKRMNSLWTGSLFGEKNSKEREGKGGERAFSLFPLSSSPLDQRPVHRLRMKYRVPKCDVIKMKFVKLWDLLSYSERTTSKTPTRQKLAIWGKLSLRY